MGDLAQAMVNIFKIKNKIDIIGVRAGEKIHETLATKLELANAEDFGGFYRIRDGARYKYEQFYNQGVADKIEDDYTSENTKRLSLKETEKLLLSLDYIKEELRKMRQVKVNKTNGNKKN